MHYKEKSNLVRKFRKPALRFYNVEVTNITSLFKFARTTMLDKNYVSL